mmetsp:Transcript_21975/g.50713  ORF Transcript_21975/g.50713 Transcript_21975/m.50713 type:complete len:153 (-) Transcript_21975:1005-1463(-)
MEAILVNYWLLRTRDMLGQSDVQKKILQMSFVTRWLGQLRMMQGKEDLVVAAELILTNQWISAETDVTEGVDLVVIAGSLPVAIVPLTEDAGSMTATAVVCPLQRSAALLSGLIRQLVHSLGALLPTAGRITYIIPKKNTIVEEIAVASLAT